MGRATRKMSEVYLGVSPRASIALMKASQAFAKMQGRDYVIPDDVQYLAPYVFAHRIILRPEARYEGITQESILHRILNKVVVPVKRFAEK